MVPKTLNTLSTCCKFLHEDVCVSIKIDTSPIPLYWLAHWDSNTSVIDSIPWTYDWNNLLSIVTAPRINLWPPTRNKKSHHICILSPRDLTPKVTLPTLSAGTTFTSWTKGRGVWQGMSDDGSDQYFLGSHLSLESGRYSHSTRWFRHASRTWVSNHLSARCSFELCVSKLSFQVASVLVFTWTKFLQWCLVGGFNPFDKY